MSDNPDYIVVRAAPEARTMCPPEFIEGKWFDRRNIPVGLPRGEYEHPRSMSVGLAVATPTGELVMRDDGAVGEVWALTIPEVTP